MKLALRPPAFARCLLFSLSVSSVVSAAITWPDGQLLPSFPTPAATQDLFYLRGGDDLGTTELPLFASLKGVVNRTQPRLFSYEGDAFAEGPHTWFENLGLGWTEYDDRWTLLDKYQAEVAGIVIYDPAVPATMNLATTIAGQTGGIVASPGTVNRLTAAPFSFPILDDLRGDFEDTVDVYEHLHEQLWPSLTHRAIVGLSPVAHQAGAREYAVGIGAAVVWLDPKVPAESAILDRFLSDMGPGSVYLGWWPEEGAGIERASSHGIATVASDYASNLTMHSGTSREVTVKPIPPKPILQNKMYVAFILSDGDNLQYVEHLMAKLWNNPDRGKVPLGWTVSPAMLDAMPGALDFYHRSATENDNLISGPSGWGYAYPNFFPDEASLAEFVKVTDDYALRSGLRVVTVWNHITGGIDQDAGVSFAKNAPSVLGLTAQNTGGGLTVYGDELPGFALSCNYCTGEQAMKDHIASAAAGWSGSEPRFILIQAQPWTDVRPTTFMNVANSLGDEYVVVRPDNWFQLLRQANELPIEPAHRIEDGAYRLINHASGKCVTVGEAEGEGLTPITQTECDDVDTQRFQVTSTSAGYVKLAPLGNEALVLDVSGGVGATEDGAKLIVWDDLGNTNQEWQPIWKERDEYSLIARHSDRCLDVPSGSLDDVQLQQWGCNGADAQAFQFADPVWPPPSAEPPTMDPTMPPGDVGPDDPEPSANVPASPPPEVEPVGPQVSAMPSDEAGCACSAAPGLASGVARFVGLGGVMSLVLWRRRRRR